MSLVEVQRDRDNIIWRLMIGFSRSSVRSWQNWLALFWLGKYLSCLSRDAEGVCSGVCSLFSAHGWACFYLTMMQRPIQRQHICTIYQQRHNTRNTVKTKYFTPPAPQPNAGGTPRRALVGQEASSVTAGPLEGRRAARNIQQGVQEAFWRRKARATTQGLSVCLSV